MHAALIFSFCLSIIFWVHTVLLFSHHLPGFFHSSKKYSYHSHCFFAFFHSLLVFPCLFFFVLCLCLGLPPLPDLHYAYLRSLSIWVILSLFICHSSSVFGSVSPLSLSLSLPVLVSFCSASAILNCALSNWNSTLSCPFQLNADTISGEFEWYPFSPSPFSWWASSCVPCIEL